MCGICGCISPATLPLDVEAMRIMRDILAHRGPDGKGEETIRGEALGTRLHGWIGHRRLKVIDLTTSADQPMVNENRSVVLTYNGEIYNYRELRRELEARGFPFRSSGDTEVVLRAYEAWGDRFVDRIDGMFALAVWDEQKARLLLARDRTGKKPLYYAVAGNRFLFASEIKSLLASPWVGREPEVCRLPEFLTYGYIPYPNTFFRGITQVPPAATVVYDVEGVHPPEEYWTPLRSASSVPPTRFAHGQIAKLVAQAVERRLVSDVPLGALLSGGIDSSIVVGLMQRAAPEPVHTFSIGFPEEPSFDERPYAQAVAKHFGTRHTEFAVDVDAVSLLDRILWHHDQPFADSSAIPTYLVSKLARDRVTVVLNGDGGDEVFGGYDRFAAARLAGYVPAFLAQAARYATRLLPLDHGYYSVQRRARRFLELAREPVKERYHSWIAVANDEILQELLTDSLRELFDPQDVRAAMEIHYRRARHLPTLDQILYTNFRTYLPDDLAVKMDRMSMASSLEARSPFLDTAVVEYVARLPARVKIGLRHLKPILRQSFFELLPPSIWERRKHGFGVPVGTWFRTTELATVFEDEVLSADARTGLLLHRPTVSRLWSEHRAGEQEHGSRLWTLLTLERWLRSLERPVTTNPPADRLGATLTTR